MFFGEVTVDSGHPFFCGANNVQIGACEIQAILAALAWCHDVNLEGQACHNQTRQYVCHWSSGQESPLHFTRAIGASCETLSGQCKKQVVRQLQTHQGTPRAVAK